MKAIAGHPIAVGFLSSRIGLSPFVGDHVCRDAWHSMSIGRRGACSWHRGMGGFDHDNWVMPAAIALGIAAGFAWMRFWHFDRLIRLAASYLPEHEHLKAMVPETALLI